MVKLNPQRRRFLMLSVAALAELVRTVGGGREALADSKTRELASVLDFQSTPSTNGTSAATAAVASARRVYFPKGEYFLNDLHWIADTEIFGDGDTTVLHMPPNAPYLINTDSGSSDEAQNVRNLYMHDLQLRATCEVDGLSEYQHLVSLNGVTNVRFENVLFRGFRGDALYIGSGNAAGMERHNRGVLVKNCRFDGINGANRNAITVIDCDDIRIEDCRFENTTADNMPGAIDIEPDRFPYHVIRNVRILNNRFHRIGGFTGVIAVSVPSIVALAPAYITVEGNISAQSRGSGAFFFFNAERPPTSTATENQIRLMNNVASGGTRPFLLTGREIIVQGNDFQDFTDAATFGFTGPNDAVRDVQVSHNRFERCGRVRGTGVAIYTAHNLAFSGNRFIDCGSGNPRQSNAVAFMPGSSANVGFTDNEFSSPSGNTQDAISKDPLHSLSPQTNSFENNKVNGLRVAFQAKESR